MDRFAALERLRNNRDFKEIISKGYMKDEAVRLVHLKAAPQMCTPELQASIIKQIDAIGALDSFFNNMRHQALLAAKAIEADEETLEELRSEEA